MLDGVVEVLDGVVDDVLEVVVEVVYGCDVVVVLALELGVVVEVEV